MTLDEFTVKYRSQLTGAMLIGMWTDTQASAMEKARHAIDIVPKVPEILKQMWADAQPNGTKEMKK